MKTTSHDIRTIVLSPLLVALFALVAMAFALTFPAVAHAEHLQGASSWTVTYPAEGGKLVDNYSAQAWADDLKGMQPGDDITFTVTLKQEYDKDSDWYMSNEVLKTLEQGAQAADNPQVYSAYTYILTYTNPAGETRTLYDSSRVGETNDNGDYAGGLTNATDALDEFFYLDTLKKGQTAHVDLKIVMDGETEQNAYFDTLAQVKMKFAVEDSTGSNTPGSSTAKGPGRGAVQTGDPRDLFPYYVAMLVSGLLLLLLAADGIRRRRNRKAEQAAGAHIRR